MESPARCPVVHFDHNSPEHSADPAESYRKIRETVKIGWTPAHGGYWVLSDYSSVFDAARDDETFSSARSEYGGDGLSVVIPKTPHHDHIPIELDPPEFRKYRRIVNPVSAPAAVEKMKPTIDRHVAGFIDSVIESGECDLTSVIGVPSIVTVEWLGLDVSEWRRYSNAHFQVLAGIPGTPEHTRAVEVDFPYLAGRIEQTITERRRDPKDDIISYLVQQEVDGSPMNDHDVFAIVDLLISGGVGTTASLVSNSLVWLSRHKDVRQRLIDHPDLLDHAIEEFLRYFSPTQALARTVTHDVEFHGCPMQKGDRVLLSWASANRDSELFDKPDEIDIERWPNRHTAFGIGVHRCAGSHLGRYMSHALISQVLERMPDYDVDLAALQPYPRQGVNTGYQRIPATFTPGRRVLTDYTLQ
ncbi:MULTISPECIES: cytochrome P450 [Rhodococcus]|jgi:cytochrome P450|uniref:Cytochrome P450 n=1 Tax=Rhodococcus aetherivorans TaxID=191292 RepID=A0A059MJ30_9NOCA|nr:MULTISPECIES: cytochrome P450 [Rhodococcus]ETT24162.1 Camphor 5-monooxygenase [Rhodococcus rhodochrous ATCC 21198]OOL32380.1 cytochrome P450 [Rhodococcus rhodochrous]AKE91919.1 cytochrome P450 [Rhodococcus aetherivorans]ANZ27827.1 cytochrome [Rhodococcus sp. WB1]KDE11027.1 cytochrome P450 [Rhodococcus aetherivorans]